MKRPQWCGTWRPGWVWTGSSFMARNPRSTAAAWGRRVIKGFRIKDEKSLLDLEPYRGAVQAFLLDTYKKGQVGGTGEVFDWHLARAGPKIWPDRPGRGPQARNVAQAIAAAQPQAVDAASGTEAAPGKKDPDKLRAFFKAILHGPLDHP